MRANLRLEAIGWNYDRDMWEQCKLLEAFGFKQDLPPRSLPWVAKISRNEYGGIQRTYLPSKRDYSGANSKGSRGVMENFILEENELYQAKYRSSWRCVETRFVAVTPNGGIYWMEDDEAEEWLKNI